MRKSIIIIVLWTCLLFLSVCSNNIRFKKNITYKEDLDHQISNNYTYKFVGESEHFYFETGKVYYNDNERELLISNFKVKDNVSENAQFSINLYFNGVLLYGETSYFNNLLTKKKFENTVIGEYGYLVEKDKNGNIIGESDSFLETTKENFKESIKLKAKYCIKSECNTEILKLKYFD